MSDESDETQVNPTVRMSQLRGYSAPEPQPPAPGPPDEKHSALVGYMSVPVHRLLPIRRSTLVMIVLFLGFGTLCYFNPPASTATVITCRSDNTCTVSNGSYSVVPNTTTTTTTTTTTPSTTTTTTEPRPAATTPATTQPPVSATTRPPVSTTTSTTPPTTTSTARGTVATTTTPVLGSGSTTTTSG